MCNLALILTNASMEKPKPVSEYSDRELLERIAKSSRIAADNSGFVKTVVVISIVLSVISIILGLK